MRIVLDTNALISCIPVTSVTNRVFLDFVNGKYLMAVTNEIICEYFEIMEQRSSRQSREYFEMFFNSSEESFLFVNNQSRYNEVIYDADDNKFVDCFLISNSNHLITSDHHIIRGRIGTFHIACLRPEDYIVIYN